MDLQLTTEMLWHGALMKRSTLLLKILLAIAMAIAACTGRQPSPPSRQRLSRSLETKRLIEASDAPQRDLVDLVVRFGDGEQRIPEVARNEPWGFEPGDEHDFWLQDKATGDYHQVTAELRQATPHAYWFVVEGVALNEGALPAAAEQFETAIYPTNQRFFGREWTPGVDGDPHLVILLAGDLGGGVSAYQNSLDEFSQAVFPFSNEMEMITLNGEGARLDGPAFACDLAHEFQHVIQWAVDRDEATWLNEAFGLLACPLNDLKASYQDFIVEAFAAQPGVQLNTWETEPEQAAAHYGAGQLFGAYFLERFGEQAVQVLAADSSNGLRSVDGALRTLGAGLDGDDLFADWVAANYLDDPDLPGRRYGYRDLELPPIRPQGVVDAGSLPVEIEASVGQYATDYFVLNGPGDFQIDFAGETLVRPAPAEPHSGDMVWWAGREQESDATLSRDFDLSGLERATLTFYTWYDVEEYDRAYVAVSTDGRQWMALPGQTTSAGPRLGVVLGPGYTGRSDGWVQERIDLTPYAGQQLQVRFEYVTDDGPIRPGFLLDDIEIPELGYRHDAEADDGGWSADGFLRLANSLPQEWLLQLITQRGDRVAVERLALDSENRGRWNVSLGPGETAVLVIAGLTRDTAEAAGYRLLFSMPGS
jgi:immune inhibitor A